MNGAVNQVGAKWITVPAIIGRNNIYVALQQYALSWRTAIDGR
jgi:hypothetical protein